jgi:hypothetical protein
VLIHEGRLHVAVQEEFKEIQRDGEGVACQFCPWAVCRHHQMLDVGEKKREKRDTNER